MPSCYSELWDAACQAQERCPRCDDWEEKGLSHYCPNCDLEILERHDELLAAEQRLQAGLDTITHRQR